jgi:hypothetical protein
MALYLLFRDVHRLVAAAMVTFVAVRSLNLSLHGKLAYVRRRHGTPLDAGRVVGISHWG